MRNIARKDWGSCLNASLGNTKQLNINCYSNLITIMLCYNLCLITFTKFGNVKKTYSIIFKTENELCV